MNSVIAHFKLYYVTIDYSIYLLRGCSEFHYILIITYVNVILMIRLSWSIVVQQLIRIRYQGFLLQSRCVCHLNPVSCQFWLSKQTISFKWNNFYVACRYLLKNWDLCYLEVQEYAALFKLQNIVCTFETNVFTYAMLPHGGSGS